MDPIRIVCQSCSSKLVVKNENLIGQTLPCPRCQNPITVTTAEGTGTVRKSSGTRSPVHQIVNSAAMTKVDDVSWDEIIAAEKLTMEYEYPANELLRSNSLGTASIEAALAQSIATNPLPTPGDLDATIAIPSLSTKPSTPSINDRPKPSNPDKGRAILLISTIAIVGFLASIVGFWGFIRWYGQSKQTVAKKDPVQVERPNGTIPPNKAEPRRDAPNPQGVPLGSPAINEPTTNQIQEPDPAPIEPTETDDTNTAPQPSIDPSAPKDPNARLANAPPKIQPTEPPKDDLLDPFDRLTEILGPRPSMPESGPGNKQLPDELDLQNVDVESEVAFHPDPKPIPIWGDRASMVLPKLKLTDTSLLNAIDMMGRLTGVGIAVDWRSCLSAGIDVSERVTYVAEGKQVAEILDALLLPRHLMLSVTPQGFPFVHADPEYLKKQLPLDWNVDGLFPPESAPQSCDLILRLAEVHEMCTYENGTIRWNEKAGDLEQSMLQSLFAELAIARNLPATDRWRRIAPEFPWCNPAPWKACSLALNQTIDMKVVVPESRPIPELLSIAADNTQFKLFIDWPACWSHGLSPNDMAMTLHRGRTLPQVLERFLVAYGLEMVPLTESSVWLTTREVRRANERVIPIRLGQGINLDDIKLALRSLAPANVDDQSRFRVVLLPGDDQVALVRMCPPQAYQLTDPSIMRVFHWEE